MTQTVLDELHIAGLVVHSIPSRMQRVVDTIAAIPGVRVHGSSPGGKLVVTLEAGTAHEMTSRMTCIQRADGVLAAALVYQCADSLEAMNEVLP
jgi:nitrate reductase NapD